ncbi:hypothetical protein C9439_00840 [archaeon SCG-AAA382B04]|nr:hypothetical protein C9439_00840 [archaeon SCG-AAA382B04]
MSLSKPSQELAEKLLQKVNFEDRLIGTKMTPTAGNKREPIFSFKELVDFLEGINVDELEFSGKAKNQKSFNQYLLYIDPSKIKNWVKNRGDEELSREISAEIKKNESYGAKLESIVPLLRKRLEQCKGVIEEKEKKLEGRDE